MAKGYGSCRRYKNCKPDAEKSEDIGSCYTGKAKLGRSDEEMYRNRRNDYGRIVGPDNGLLPIWASGFNI